MDFATVAERVGYKIYTTEFDQLRDVRDVHSPEELSKFRDLAETYAPFEGEPFGDQAEPKPT
jgi:cobalamin biosynthesis protein CobT